jgi:hypothetical protein
MATKKSKESVKKVIKTEKTEIKLLIRDFYELKLVFKLIKDAKKAEDGGNHKEAVSKIKKAFSKFRRGIFGSEEKIERRLAKTFKNMKEMVYDLKPILNKLYPNESGEITKLIRQAEIYNADLEKLGSRGGQIEKELKAAKDDYKKLKPVFADVQKEFSDIQAFEELLNQLLHKTKLISSQFEKVKLPKLPPVMEFPSGMSVVSIGYGKLIVLNPNYLLGKHGAEGKEQVASKFYQLKTPKQLYGLLLKYAKPKILSGNRVEIKEAKAGMVVGEDAMIKTKDVSKWGVLTREEVRGHMINSVETTKDIPVTKLLNIILVKFDSKFGNNVDEDFEKKYGASFSNYQVYAVMTAFPGIYAPPATDTGFWSKHALLKKNSKESSIEITGFEGNAESHYQPIIKFNISGRINKNNFSIRTEESGLRMAPSDYNFNTFVNDVVKHFSKQLIKEGAVAKYSEDEFEHLLKIIFEKIKTEPQWRKKLEELLHSCNSIANSIQNEWDRFRDGR